VRIANGERAVSPLISRHPAARSRHKRRAPPPSPGGQGCGRRTGCAPPVRPSRKRRGGPRLASSRHRRSRGW